ncbi:hypothetical protein GQ53DRAFT_851880 [Thozetella sp. PMI_491]|nr:hypothetical protein GQ53DRAFT_851880 [Thozetella sp. PMI_491]
MSPHVSLETWEECKAIIHDLYIIKGWKLDRVQEHMEIHHGFVKGKSSYTTQLKEWGFRKYLKDVTPEDCKIVKYKITKARKKGQKVDLCFCGQPITASVLRGERFFLSLLEENKLNNQAYCWTTRLIAQTFTAMHLLKMASNFHSQYWGATQPWK